MMRVSTSKNGIAVLNIFVMFKSTQ